MKQAGAQRNHKFNKILLKLGLVQRKSDKCVFINTALYVDDV